jgi:hypothetical protein
MTFFILILGNPDPTILQKRLERGFQELVSILEKIKDDDVYVILSGKGKGVQFFSKHYINECDYMFEYFNYKINSLNSVNDFHKNKIHLICENKSNSTVENMICSFEIIKQLQNIKNIYPQKTNVIICTSTFHIERSKILANIFNKYNFNLYFIHTNEIISEEEKTREANNLERFQQKNKSRL